MISNAEKMMTSMESSKMDLSTPIEDRHMRHMLIDVSMALEEMVLDGRGTLDRTITKTTPFGLEIVGSMSRPREDKPIVFKYQYRMNRATFKAWVDEHAYMMGGECTGFKSMGISIMIPGPGIERYHKTSFTVVVRYGEHSDEELPMNLLDETAVFVVHREVVSEHEWLVSAHQG